MGLKRRYGKFPRNFRAAHHIVIFGTPDKKLSKFNFDIGDEDKTKLGQKLFSLKYLSIQLLILNESVGKLTSLAVNLNQQRAS